MSRISNFDRLVTPLASYLLLTDNMQVDGTPTRFSHQYYLANIVFFHNLITRSINFRHEYSLFNGLTQPLTPKRSKSARPNESILSVLSIFLTASENINTDLNGGGLG